jgi:hypothetical protein
MQCSLFSFMTALVGSFVGLYVVTIGLMVLQGIQGSQFRGEVRDAQDRLLGVKRPGLIKMQDENQDAYKTTIDTATRIKNLFRREVAIIVGVVSIILAVLFTVGACSA